MLVAFLKDLCKKHFVHFRGSLFALEHVDSLHQVEGALIFLKMVIVSYRIRNGVLIHSNKSKSLAVLANTSLETAALVLQTLPNESIGGQIEAAQFLEKVLKTISKRVDHLMPYMFFKIRFDFFFKIKLIST